MHPTDGPQFDDNAAIADTAFDGYNGGLIWSPIAPVALRKTIRSTAR